MDIIKKFYLEMTYIFIAMMFIKHRTMKANTDYIILCILYLVLAILYKHRGNGHAIVTKKDKYKKQYSSLMAILFFATSLIFLKRLYVEENCDYIALAFAYLFTGIIKYNLIIKNDINMSTMQKLNISSDLCASIIFGKCAVIGFTLIDYIFLFGIGSMYFYTEYSLY